MKVLHHLLMALIYGRWGTQKSEHRFKIRFLDFYFEQHFLVIHLHHLIIYCEYDDSRR